MVGRYLGLLGRYFYLALTACALIGCGHLKSGAGFVRNPVTGDRLSGVKVTLVCDSLNSFHGSTNVRNVTVITNDKGEYRFSSEDVRGCDFGPLRAEKPGYVVTELWEPAGCPPSPSGSEQYVASQICMVEKGQIPATRIKYLHDQMTNLKDGWIQLHRERKDPNRKDPWNPSRNYLDYLHGLNQPAQYQMLQQLSPYYQIMGYFYEASAFAFNHDLRSDVKKEYCQILRSMYESLSDDEREFSRQQRNEIKIEGIGRTWMTFDYRKEVEPVCDRNDVSGWNYGRAYEDFASLMQVQIGKNAQDGLTYRMLYWQSRVGTKKLANGNIEEQYRHGRDGKCPTFIEIEPISNVIVGWRREGERDDCGVLPP